MQAAQYYLIFQVHKIPSLTSFSLYLNITSGESLLMGAMSMSNLHSQHPSLNFVTEIKMALSSPVSTPWKSRHTFLLHRGKVSIMAWPSQASGAERPLMFCYFKNNLPILSYLLKQTGYSHLTALVIRHYQEENLWKDIQENTFLYVQFSHIKTYLLYR